MWPEIEIVRKENRHELILAGSSINERLKKEGLDKALFTLSSLNFLNIHETELKEIPEDIQKLEGLQTLVLHTNKLESVNQLISKLHQIKVLDLSRNCLETIPDVFNELVNIVTINMSGNKLTDFPKLINNTKLAVLDLSNNKLKAFPDICYSEISSLAEIKICNNEIEAIPNDISVLSSLKVLDISSNKIKIIPGELSDCGKLKDVNLKQNPVSDRRLFKLIDQCRTKQVLDYVKQHCPKSTLNESSKKSKGQKNSEKSKKDSQIEESASKLDYKYTLKVQYTKGDFSVVALSTVKKVREFILGCVVNDITFTEDTFKKFIQLQNKLHETICDKRNAATIATHDFKKLPSGNLMYKTMKPEELKLKPLNRNNIMTGEELFKRLQTEAQNLRKEKKRNTYSGIHKYLYLIEGHSEYPCLLNAAEEVISFPPITNSDVSKIDINTTSIFVEVTSSISQHICRKILDSILKEMILLFDKDLTVEQVRVVDLEGNLKYVYPSKVDLNYEGNTLINVVRE